MASETEPIRVLERSLEEQEQILATHQKDYKDAIETGKRAQAVVDGQQRRVLEIKSAIRSLTAEYNQAREVLVDVDAEA